jgi:hypothetical protein
VLVSKEKTKRIILTKTNHVDMIISQSKRMTNVLALIKAFAQWRTALMGYISLFLEEFLRTIECHR